MPGQQPVSIVLNNKTFLEAVEYLIARDSALAGIVEQYGIPKIKYRKPGFSTLLYIILEQQVSLASAAAVYKKLLNNSGKITPEKFLTYTNNQLKEFGFSRQKSEYCRLLAQSVLSKALRLSALSRLTDDEVRNNLMKQKGVGKWTSDIYLLFVLRRPDIWPRNDLALISTIGQIKRFKKVPSEKKLDRIARRWKPWRSVAARLLWHHYLSK